MSWKIVAVLFVGLFVVPRLLWLIARSAHRDAINVQLKGGAE